MRNGGAGLLAFALLGAGACDKDDGGPDLRGGGFPVARMEPSERAGVYDLALRQAFDVNGSLVLLIDPARLPRAGGWQRGERIPAPVLGALERRGTIRGRCEPAAADSTGAPNCDNRSPGYLVRLSDIFARGADTLRVFVAVDRYRPAGAEGPYGRFAFEDGYDLVPADGGWRVVRRSRRTID